MTQPTVLPICFYIFHDTRCLQNQLSYTASERLRIIKFKIPHEASTSALDAITVPNQLLPKHVSFHTCIHTDATNQPQNSRQYTPQISLLNATLKKLTSSQDHHTSTSTTANVCDIVALKKAFPASFDTIENISGTNTMHAGHSIPPVQHTYRK